MDALEGAGTKKSPQPDRAAPSAPIGVTARGLRQAIRDDMCGGIVLRAFRLNGELVRAGAELSEEQVRGMGRANLEALRRRGSIHLLSKKAGEAPAVDPRTQAFMVHTGAGKYDVIEGVKINDEPLSKEEAQALIGPITETAN